MSTDPNDVNRMLDEIAAQEGGGKLPNAPADANALLEAATKPPVTQPRPPAQPAKIDPEKFGQLVNENADLRRQMDQMRTDVETLRTQTKPAEPPKPVPTAADDGGWGLWGQKGAGVVNEIDDATWLANPKEAVRQALERVLTRQGRELATHSSNLAYQRAWEVGTAMMLDNDFGARHPDLVSTTMGQQAVRVALDKVQGDQRFQTLMRNRVTRPKALDIVAVIAKQELGQSSEVDAVLDTPGAPVRKAVFAERAGARPMGVGPTLTPERQDEAMQSVIDLHRART